MSAWVVSKRHIDLLVRAAMRASVDGQPRCTDKFRFWRTDEDGNYAGWYEVDTLAETREGDDYCTPITPSQLGQILVSENVRSVHHRYPDTDPDAGDLPGPIDAFYMAPYVYTDPGRTLTPGEVFKAISCLDYQSCEHDGWRKSDAFAFCQSLRETYCALVDGYASAPWGFENTSEVAA